MSAASSHILTTATGLNINQLYLVGGGVGLLAIALLVACFFASRRKPAQPAASVSEQKSLGKGGRCRRAAQSESESEWSASEEEEEGWERRGGGEWGEERRGMLR